MVLVDDVTEIEGYAGNEYLQQNQYNTMKYEINEEGDIEIDEEGNICVAQGSIDHTSLLKITSDFAVEQFSL